MSRLSKLGFINTQRTSLPVRKRIRSRGVPTALVGHEVACTDVVAEAEELMSGLFGPSRLHQLTPEVPFQLTMNAIRLRDVTMAYVDFHTATRLDIPATGDHYSVHMPTSGAVSFEHPTTTEVATAYQAVVINPGSRVSMVGEVDAPQLVIRIERAALDFQLARLLGSSVISPVQFDVAMNLASEPAVRWMGAIQLLSSEVMTEHSLIQQGVGAGPVEELVITSLLWVQGSNYHAQLTDTGRPHERTAVRRSLTYIEEHLADPITVGDIAHATHMSVRSVQQGFRDDLGTTPMEYVRNLRLERVRADLIDSLRRDGVTVTDIAHRWGFSHLGNFSVAYRRRFGESPSKTLGR